MNEYQFDTPPADSTAPLAEEGSRQDPEERPQLPTSQPDEVEVNLYGQTNTSQADVFLDRMQYAGDTNTVTPSLENYMFNSVVSQEGIFDFFKNLFSPAPTPADKQAVAVLMQKYRNPQWLAQQNFAVGSVDLGNAAAILSVNGTPSTDILGAVRRATTEIQSEIRRVKSGITPLIAKYERKVDEIDDSMSVDDLRDMVKECNDLFLKINTYLTSNGVTFSLGGAKPTTNKPNLADALGRVSSNAFPALDAKGVETVAGLILGLITIYQTTQHEINDQLATPQYSFDNALGTLMEFTSEEINELSSDLITKIETPFVMSYLIELIRALTVYIDKSVNGFGGAAARVANEGFLDKVKEFFSGSPKTSAKRELSEAELTEFFKTTLQSDEWWSKHEPIVGEVKVPVLKFMANGDFMGIAQKMKSNFEPDQRKNVLLTKQYYQKYIKPGVDLIMSGKFDAAQIKAVMLKMDDLEVPLLSDGHDLDTGKQSVTLPALTKDQIKQLAGVIVQLWNDREAFQDGSFSPEFVNAQNGKDGKFLWNTTSPETKRRLEVIKDAQTHSLATSLVKKIGTAFTLAHDSIYDGDMIWWDNYHAVTMALIAWIEKSLGRSISTEQFHQMFAPFLRVSNEGILDTIKAFFVKPKKDEMLESESAKLGDVIKETLLNEKWLAAREVGDGKVSVNMPSYIASGELGKVLDTLAEGDKAAIEHNAKVATTYYNEHFAQVVDMLRNGKPETWTESGLGDLQQKLEEIDAGLEFKFGKRIAKGSKPVTLPILTKEKIKQVGNLIIKLREQEEAFLRNSLGQTFYPNLYSENRKFRFGSNGDESFKQRLKEITDPQVKKATYDLIGTLNDQVDWSMETIWYTLSEVHYWENYQDTITALCSWVDKSLGRTASK